MKNDISIVMQKISIDSHGCWIWNGYKTRSGYGTIHIGGKQKRAHRVVYEFIKGSIPDGIELDHLCRNKLCCNPDHLDPVDHRTNVLRGSGIPAKNAQMTHCKNGHAFTKENTYIKKNGNSRVCRMCAAAYFRERRKTLRKCL